MSVAVRIVVCVAGLLNACSSGNRRFIDSDGGEPVSPSSDGGSDPADAGGAPIDLPDNPVTEGCEGAEITMSGVYDLDIDSVRISGQITLNGGPLPETAAGQIIFRNSLRGFEYGLDLGSIVDGSYEVVLPSAHYDVRFEGTTCVLGIGGVFPCGSGALTTGSDLTAPGVLNLNLESVRVRGEVTLGGEPLPTATLSRGRLVFESDLASSSLELNAAGPVIYDVELIAGTYDVLYQGNSALCGTPATVSPLPCNTGEIFHRADLSTAGVLNVDVNPVRAAGTLVVTGATIGAVTPYGGLAFVDARGGRIETPRFETIGTFTYAMALFSGEYDVLYVPGPSACGRGLPCVEGSLGARRFDHDDTYDLTMSVVRLTGAVTVNGMPMVAETQTRGALEFSRTEDETFARTSAITASGAATYSIDLLEGRYDVWYRHNPTLCATRPGAGVPCVDGVVMSALYIGNSASRDIDLVRVLVTGEVTIAGAMMGTGTGSRGRISFHRADGGIAMSRDFSTTGAASYEVSLLAGDYDVRYEGNVALCVGALLPNLPCASGLVRAGLPVRGDAAHDFDLNPIGVQGRVTLTDRPLPDELATRGALEFIDLDGGGATTSEFPATGAAYYQLTMLPGRYVVVHTANPLLCSAAATPEVPCASQVVLGCD